MTCNIVNYCTWISFLGCNILFHFPPLDYLCNFEDLYLENYSVWGYSFHMILSEFIENFWNVELQLIKILKDQFFVNMNWIVFLWYGWPMKGISPYFQPGSLSEILTIANVRHAASRVWACAEPEFRIKVVKLNEVVQ